MAEAIRQAKAGLRRERALLGFAGSPWTLANFMLEGGSSHGHTKALQMFRYDRALYDSLAEELTLAVIEFLQMQINAGVDAVQIFDSLGGAVPTEDFERGFGAMDADDCFRAQRPGAGDCFLQGQPLLEVVDHLRRAGHRHRSRN